jgi:hypothetical protein
MSFGAYPTASVLPSGETATDNGPQP